MRKKLIRVGEHYALIVERPILDLLGIDPAGELDVETDGMSLTIKPVAGPETAAAGANGRREAQTQVARPALEFEDREYYRSWVEGG